MSQKKKRSKKCLLTTNSTTKQSPPPKIHAACFQPAECAARKRRNSSKTDHDQFDRYTFLVISIRHTLRTAQMRVPISIKPIHSTCSENQIKSDELNQAESIIIELQGTLEFSNLKDSDDTQRIMIDRFGNQNLNLNGIEIGKLDLLNTAKPILKIGNHELEGKIFNLNKPLMILRKQSRLIRKLKKPDEANQKTKDHSHQILDIVDVINRKIVFSSRPQPVIE
ncbi:hypothetical protein O181_059074 [Austropuccinia psidii MF-1]|uniref:Uncharacterized protein n=1 Tax=Austropuccinia psidii MF-1 TaxID=1389203 RepID=A0A9Q3EDL5_9BASI|nr:hypothetical protein [Austropuccinia psidii MF-1]